MILNPSAGGGSGTGDMLAATYDPQGKAQDVFAYADGMKADTFGFRVKATDWSGNTVRVVHEKFTTSGFAYIVTAKPVSSGEQIDPYWFWKTGIYPTGISYDYELECNVLTLKKSGNLDVNIVINIVRIPHGGNSIFLNGSWNVGEPEALEKLYRPSNSFVISATAIPAGRMIGDVDGDGMISMADSGLILSYLSNKVELDATQMLCADTDGSGVVTASDSLTIQQYDQGERELGAFSGDVLGNWTVNPDYATDEAQFYIDLTVSGMTATKQFVFTCSGKGSENIVRVEPMAGKLRVYAKLPPIEPLPYKILES